MFSQNTACPPVIFRFSMIWLRVVFWHCIRNRNREKRLQFSLGFPGFPPLSPSLSNPTENLSASSRNLFHLPYLLPSFSSSFLLTDGFALFLQELNRQIFFVSPLFHINQLWWDPWTTGWHSLLTHKNYLHSLKAMLHKPSLLALVSTPMKESLLVKSLVIILIFHLTPQLASLVF